MPPERLQGPRGARLGLGAAVSGHTLGYFRPCWCQIVRADEAWLGVSIKADIVEGIERKPPQSGNHPNAPYREAVVRPSEDDILTLLKGRRLGIHRVLPRANSLLSIVRVATVEKNTTPPECSRGAGARRLHSAIDADMCQIVARDRNG